MKTASRRPSGRAVAGALGLLVAALVLETAAAATGGPLRLGPVDARVLWLGGLAGAAVWMAFDFARIRGLPPPEIERVLPANLALHDWAWVRVRIDADARLRPLALVDAPPADAHTDGLPLRLPAQPAERGPAELHYRLRPNTRGDAAFGPMQLAARSPAGLWHFTAPCATPATIRVFPNFATAARYDALLAEAQEAHAGIVRRQRRGEGTEFHQLREYRRGDSTRQVDWKATSRKQTLIAREYQDERDQRIVFVLDTSRRMRAKEGDLSHFDHALDAMILLAHVALRGGDAVGLLCFGEQTRWLAPGKGVGRVHRLLETVYDLEPTTFGADFRLAGRELGLRAPRRALVVLLTTLRAEDETDLLAGLEILRRRHLVLVADLRPEGLDAARAQPVTDFAGALRYIGAFGHAQERHRLGESLQRRGVLVLDTAATRLTPRLVSHYFAIKRSGML